MVSLYLGFLQEADQNDPSNFSGTSLTLNPFLYKFLEGGYTQSGSLVCYPAGILKEIASSHFK